MLFTEIINVYYQNHIKPILSKICRYNAELVTVKVPGAYIYHWSFKVLTVIYKQETFVIPRISL
jgi:hypothetical protein